MNDQISQLLQSGGFQSSLLMLVLVVLVVIAVKSCVKIVPQGQQWTVERFGRYTTTFMPGLNLLMPFIDRVGFKLSMMERVLDVPSQTVISKDNAAVTSDGVVFFTIVDAAKAAYQVQDLTRAITNLVVTNLRSVLGSMELDHMLSNREEINERLLTAIEAATATWGVHIGRIEVRELSMAPELQHAMNLQMTAERERRAVVTQANGQKEAAILMAEGQRQAEVLKAEGEKEAAFLQAEAREREAQAEAKATREVSEAIGEGDAQALQYFLGNKYIEALGQIGQSENSKLVLMPLEASGVTGAVAGITELLKNTAGSK